MGKLRNRDRTMDLKLFIKNNMYVLDAKYEEQYPDHCDQDGEPFRWRHDHYNAWVSKVAKDQMVKLYASTI